MVEEKNKHQLYTGKIEEFSKIIKYIKSERMEEWAKDGKLNDIAKGVKETIGRGLSKFPRTCDETCEILDTCPFALNDAMPVGDACPLESFLMENLMGRLIEELQLDRDELTASDMITLTSVTINYVLSSFRMYGLLSLQGVMTKGTVRNKGEVMEMDVVNPLIEQMLSINEQNQKLLKNLHLTRLDRAKHKPAVKQAKAEDQYDKVQVLEDLKNAGVDLEQIQQVLRKKNDDKKS